LRSCCGAFLLLLAACGPPRKVLLFPREIPMPALLRARVAELERARFDGLVLDVPVAGRERTLAWLVWSRESVAPEALQAAARDLEATRFRRFQHNFLRVNAMPGDVDWFEEDWSTIAANAGIAAAFAKRAGLRGLVLDTEEYGEARPFDYAGQRFRETRGFGEYAAQARRRGREMIAAINAGYPDVTLLVLFGHTLPYRRAGGDASHARLVTDSTLAGVEYGLLAPFLDGVLEAASPGTVYVDAYESSYPYRERAEFARARGLVRSEASAVSRVPVLYRRRVQTGFGLWLDFESDRRGWDVADPARNYFSPAGFGQALSAALAETDGYVWVYSEKPDWLTGRDLPSAYVRALEAARY
jgi:hypothetical protein